MTTTHDGEASPPRPERRLRPGGAQLQAARTPETMEAVRAEIERYRRRGELTDGVYAEPRCRVCKSQEVRQAVNRMLAAGLTYQEILRSLEPHNAAVAKNQQVTYRSLLTHAVRHFRVHDLSRSIYRDIVERRALEEGRDIVEGVATLINTYSYLETMMVKGYHGMIDDDTEVSPEAGMRAALELREISREDTESGAQRIAEMSLQLERIVTAIREVVPERYHAAILAHAEGRNAVPLDVEEAQLDESVENGDVEDDDDVNDDGYDDDDDF